MKALFIFDTLLVKKNNDYFGMTLTYDFFKNRYLNFYEEITVSTRYKDEKNVKGDINGYKITNGEKVNVIPIKNYSKIPDAVKNKKKINSELLSLIKNADVIIIRMPSVLGIMACKICNKLNKDYRIEMVACPLDGYLNHTNKLGKIIAPIMYLKTKKCLKVAPKVLYVTKDFLQKRYPTNGQVFSCSDVILEKSSENVLKNRLSRLKNMKFDELNICTVANVELKSKGQEYVIKAISRLNKKGYKFKYYLVGNGSNERLKRIAKKENVQNDVIFVRNY